MTALLLSLLALSLPTPQQDEVDWPQTRAERTDYAETSHYADVLRFLADLRAAGAPLEQIDIGTSAGGRAMPMVIAADPPVAGPGAARRDGRLVAYVQANIHGGEVEGKEVAQMLLREIAQDHAAGRRGLLEHLVILVVPVYNIDGNEGWGEGARQRPSQNGPETVGLRPNADNLDLNRDCMKVKSPEMQAVLEHIYVGWDPELTLDLHTTNGTRHGYTLTYSPPLGPNTESGVLALARDVMLPEVRRTVREQHGLEMFDYGNASRRGEPRWVTFGAEGRYVTNYVGLRNRLGILSEAVSYAPFRERVSSTHAFVRSVLEFTAANADLVRETIATADRNVASWGSSGEPRQLGVRFQPASRGVETVLLERRVEGERPARNAAVTAIDEVEMPIFDRFEATQTRPLPAAYAFPPEATAAAELLRRHGIRVDTNPFETELSADVFEIEEVNASQRAFQGQFMVSLKGAFATKTVKLPAGWFIVPTAQPLAVLAFQLLEPESSDGVAAWNYLDEMLEAESDYPIWKLHASPTR